MVKIRTEEVEAVKFEFNIMNYLASQSTTQIVHVQGFDLDYNELLNDARKALGVDSHEQVIITMSEKANNIYNVELV